MSCTKLTPAEARKAIADGARLVDIRGADEYAREHIPGAINLPLDRVEELDPGEAPVVFHCRSGMRTELHSARLDTATGTAPAFILEGGLDGWRGAGQATHVDRKQPLEIMRQVQITAGALILLGVLLGFVWTPALFGLSAFVGGGLIVAGATGWCGMAQLLRVLPWNRQAGA